LPRVITPGEEGVRLTWSAIYGKGTNGLERCAFFKVFSRLDDPGRHLVSRLDCRCWRCRRCGPRLKGKHEINLSHRIDPAPRIEAITIPTDDWGTLRRQINRQGGNYARLKVSPEEFRIVTTAAVGGREIYKDDSLVTLAWIRSQLVEVSFDKRAVTTSDGWRLPPTLEGEPKWYPVCRAGADFERVLRDLGVRYEGDGKSYYFTLPRKIINSTWRYAAFIATLIGERAVGAG
jgi:hypothetical protein